MKRAARRASLTYTGAIGSVPTTLPARWRKPTNSEPPPRSSLRRASTYSASPACIRKRCLRERLVSSRAAAFAAISLAPATAALRRIPQACIGWCCRSSETRLVVPLPRFWADKRFPFAKKGKCCRFFGAHAPTQRASPVLSGADFAPGDTRSPVSFHTGILATKHRVVSEIFVMRGGVSVSAVNALVLGSVLFAFPLEAPAARHA